MRAAVAGFLLGPFVLVGGAYLVVHWHAVVFVLEVFGALLIGGVVIALLATKREKPVEVDADAAARRQFDPAAHDSPSELDRFGFSIPPRAQGPRPGGRSRAPMVKP